MQTRAGLSIALLAAALASPATAHLDLQYPASRYGHAVLKEGPCGVAGGERSATVTRLEPGAAIEVVWDEYIDHPGHFRIAFDQDGDDDFVDPACLDDCHTRAPQIERYSNHTVLLDGIPDTPEGGQGSAVVTLPDVECDRCTLQVVQVMYDKPPYIVPGNDLYYQCARTSSCVARRAPPAPATATSTVAYRSTSSSPVFASRSAPLRSAPAPPSTATTTDASEWTTWCVPLSPPWATARHSRPLKKGRAHASTGAFFGGLRRAGKYLRYEAFRSP